jgi:hypothetical protein
MSLTDRLRTTLSCLGVLLFASPAAAQSVDHPFQLPRDGQTWLMALATALALIVGVVVMLVIQGRKAGNKETRDDE